MNHRATSHQTRANVLIIGAGPAGIASAYALRQAGISYRLIDRAGEVASTWNSLYPSLRLNTTRFFSHMTGKKFPLWYGLYPTGKQYHRYLVEYAREQGIQPEFGVQVNRVAPEGDLWRVETNLGVDCYPAVISATGRFGNPIWPEIDGMDDFTGQMLHAHEFTNAADFAGKRVMVVGNGPSGVDISIDVGKVSPPSSIAIRSGIVLRPRYPLGLSTHVWMMIGELLPEKWGHWLVEKVSNLRYTHQTRYGLKLPGDKDSGSAIPYRGPELIHAIRDGYVIPVDAPIRFSDKTAFLADGSQLEIDAVIMATGYQPVLSTYLDMDYDTDDQGWPLRDLEAHPNGREVLGHPGLYLVGVFYKGKGAMYNFNVEARIAAKQIQARLQAMKQRSTR